MNYLLDTCVLSELTKPAPAVEVIAWIEGHSESSYYISSLTVGELMRGIKLLSLISKREKLEKWIQNLLLNRFKDRIIPINEAIAIRWGALTAKREQKGRTLPAIDSLLAATAQEHSLILVTRNIKDFKDLDVQLLNPWSGR